MIPSQSTRNCEPCQQQTTFTPVSADSSHLTQPQLHARKRKPLQPQNLGPSWVPHSSQAGSQKGFPAGSLTILAAGGNREPSGMGFRWVEHGCHLGWDSDGVCMGAIWDGFRLGPSWVLYGMGFSGVHMFHDSCKSSDAAVLAARAMRVIEAMRDWMSSNRLRLNADKTQFIWLGTSHFLDVLQINSIPANELVNNSGVYFDPELLMERQVNKLCQVCYFHMWRLRTVRRSLTKESLLTLVHAFITSRVDHCNRVLYGSNGYLLDRLQSVLNSAARLILCVPKFGSVSAAIRNALHWLPIGKRIRFKTALLVRHCIVGAAPEYLTELCRPVSSSSGRQSLRFASRGDLIVPRFRLRRSGYRAFAVSGPHVWNSLPTEIRQSCNNLLQFKSKLKTFLFQKSWAFLICGSISNEGPCKYSILLLLLLLLLL